VYFVVGTTVYFVVGLSVYFVVGTVVYFIVELTVVDVFCARKIKQSLLIKII
jgi:hypothetical protein